MPTSNSQPRKCRVLFVDDEVRVTQNLRAVLRKLPLEVRTAASGEEGIGVLEAEAIDIVVSDERMPGMQGSQFLTEVRRRWPDTIRIILTGQASLEATIDAINEGRIFRFLSKPCDSEDLIATLEEAVALCVKQQVDDTRPQPPSGVDAPLGGQFEGGLGTCWMAYQPIVAPDGRVYGYEALLRPEHADFPGPMELLHTAEQLGRIPDLERRVCELVAQELDSAAPDWVLFMNVHPQMLNESDFFEADHPLHRHAKRVFIEITERAPLDTIVDCSAKMAALRDRGYRIALDDLGAGYSGLVNFADLKPDLIKFDRGLVSHVDARPIQSRLVASMIRVCHEMGIATVGEGIERPQEFEHLAAAGCDYFQGFLLGKPGKPFPEPTWFRNEDRSRED